MALISKNLLKISLQKNKHLISQEKIDNLYKLLKEKIFDRIQNGTFRKEESEKPVILPDFFKLLGYSHPQNFEFEFGIKSRSADVTLGLEYNGIRKPEIAIEWKGIDTKNLDGGKVGETPVSQMWDYMGKMNAGLGIVGNFLQWRIYSKTKGQTEYQEFILQDLIDNREKLLEMIFLLSPGSLLKFGKIKSEFEELIEKSIIEQEQITKRFYNDYKQRRLNIFEHLVENNKEISKHFLLEKSQKILDRLIFVMFCEDGFLLPSNIFKSTFNLGKSNRSRSPVKIWEQFQYLFEDIDKGRYDINPQINGFNGGLFAEDLELNNLIIKDEIWSDLIKLAEYDFASDLDVNILGHIFEQSISDIEEIKADLEGKTTDKKKSKRKKDGIFYTPEYITDYIVSETVGNWLQENNDKLEQIKILDPAGGSGAFPNQVHNFLTKKHEAKFKELSSGENDLFNQVQIDKSILQNNIFMVDLQPESVEIAKLSLWLKTAQKNQKLNNLDENVKCGNSLINDPILAGNTAFDWEKEFGWLKNDD